MCKVCDSIYLIDKFKDTTNYRKAYNISSCNSALEEELVRL